MIYPKTLALPSVDIRQGPRGLDLPVPKKYNLLQTYSLEVVTVVQLLGRLLKRYKKRCPCNPSIH